MNQSDCYLQFVNPGVFSSLQDQGRQGGGAKGVPDSGYMDEVSAGIANLLVGNAQGSPCLEMFQSRIRILVKGKCVVAFAGSPSALTINGYFQPFFQRLTLNSDDVMEINPSNTGNWIYLAIAGEFVGQESLGSKSMYIPITDKGRYRAGDKVEILPLASEYTAANARLNEVLFWKNEEIPVYPGPDFNSLERVHQEGLFNRSFTVSSSINRMGYQLNEVAADKIQGILSAPVYPGTVQLTPSGRLIILMRDAQTTGGYGRVLQLSRWGASKLAQKRPGEKIQFVPVEGLPLHG